MGHIRARAAARFCAATIALAMVSGTALAQQAGGSASAVPPEVPFVSRLRADAAHGVVRLTWKDSPDVVGTCLIYRSPSQITARTIDAATLVGQVESGAQSWFETPPDAGEYFYAIVMQDKAGVRYPLLVPYRNVTTAAVSAAAAQPAPATSSSRPTPTLRPAPTSTTTTQAPKPAPATVAVSPAPAVVPAPATTVVPAAPAPAVPAVSTPAPAGPDIPARISGISSALSANGDSISVTFASSSSSRDLLLFWSSSPLTLPADLISNGAAAPLDPGTTRYVLPVLPGTTWWFAVLDSGLYKVGQFPLVPGLNATSSPIHVPGKSVQESAAPAVARRALPLPSLSLGRGAQTVGTGAVSGVPELPPVTPVSAATSRAIDLLLRETQATPVARTPRILDKDTSQPEGGEAAQLADILQRSFQSGDMPGAEQGLLGYLSVPRSPAVAAHARFYLGQSYWFQGRTREALMEFLVAGDYYPGESQPWIDASLEKLGAEDR